MNRRWQIALITCLFFISTAVLPYDGAESVLADGGTVTVASESVNVRSGPGLSYEVTGSLKSGETASVLSRSGDWIQVDTRNGSGWVASWLTTVQEDVAENTGRTAVSTVNRLNVRTQPDLNAAVLTQLNAGDQVQVLSMEGDWAEITARNIQGFVSTQYISLTDQQQEQPAAGSSSASSFEIAVSALNVRTDPDLNSDKITTVRKGDVYPVVAMTGNWVEIRLSESETGWVYSFYGHLTDEGARPAASAGTDSVTVTNNGTNVRVEPSTSSDVVARLNAGDALQVTGSVDDWYEVALSGGRTGYIASWVVTDGDAEAAGTETKKEVDRKPGTLNGLTIVLDPGHGGNDGGTTGIRQTAEKDLTLKTAEILSHHLSAAGADVVLTRQSDVYVDLRKRVSVGHQLAADAFISIHYDATDDRSVSGFTSYYMYDAQKAFAESVNEGLANKLTIRDRGTQPGNYLVLRENRQLAILVELGFLSNFTEERVVSSSQFREQAALGLYEGIVNYFDAQLEE